MAYKHKQIVVLMSNKEGPISVAIRRLKQINGLYINHIGLEKKNEKQKGD